MCCHLWKCDYFYGILYLSIVRIITPKTDWHSMHDKLEPTGDSSSDHALHRYFCLHDQGRGWSKQIKSAASHVVVRQYVFSLSYLSLFCTLPPESCLKCGFKHALIHAAQDWLACVWQRYWGWNLPKGKWIPTVSVEVSWITVEKYHQGDAFATWGQCKQVVDTKMIYHLLSVNTK